jgi:hypothetical protein
MFTHRIVVDVPIYGRVLVFFEYERRRLPNSGTDKAYSPTVRKVIEFDFSEILESEVVNHELV